MPQSDFSDNDVFAAFPGVLVDRDNIEHYRGLLAEQLLINRCADCGFWIYPHRPMCTNCRSWNVSAQPVSGKGTLYMFALQPGADAGAQPTIVAGVQLAEQPGLRYLGRLLNCAPDKVRHDMPLRLVWTEQPEFHNRMPAFEPDNGVEV